MSQRKQKLSEVSDLLEIDIKRGIFTPFLGAGASSLRSSGIDLGSYPWKEVATILSAISSRVRGEKDCREFLCSFTEQRLKLNHAKALTIITSATLPKKDSSELCEHILVRLQAELVRASVLMTRYFGVRFSEERLSIQSIDECSVEFLLGSGESVAKGIPKLPRECLDRLFAAVDLILELNAKAGKSAESPYLADVPGVSRCLEKRQIYRKLLTLIVGLIGNNRELCDAALAKYRVGGRLPVPTDVEEGKASSFGKLRLDAIQWMSDLLWYTIRYWVPWYPTTSELAFELALVVKDGPPRPAELAQAAQALENRDNLGLADRAGSKRLARIVGDLVTYCEKVQERKESTDRQTKAFYCAIAAVIQYQFERYKAAVDAAPKQGSLKDAFKLDAGTGSAQAKIPVPIVFTTNFDCALEKILESSDLCFHTVYPVLRGSPEDSDSGAPIWMIRTKFSSSEKRNPLVIEWGSICDPDNQNPRDPFKGPIIVKLHGSPSLNLDETTEQHWIVLSEAGYLDSLGDGFRVPVWLGRQLTWLGKQSSSQDSKLDHNTQEAPRSLWFLGYSISDWNVRLRLYEHCNEHRKLLGGRRNAVDRPKDVFRTAILGRLDVGQCEGELNDLPNMIQEVFDENDFRASEKVDRLIEIVRGYTR